MTYNLNKITGDFRIVKLVDGFLSNRMFIVSQTKKRKKKNSRWTNSDNCLPQGSVLAPTVFNIHTCDQPISKDQSIICYIYADDSTIVMQYRMMTVRNPIFIDDDDVYNIFIYNVYVNTKYKFTRGLHTIGMRTYTAKINCDINFFMPNRDFDVP